MRSMRQLTRPSMVRDAPTVGAEATPTGRSAAQSTVLVAPSLTRTHPFGSRPPTHPPARALSCPKCLGVIRPGSRLLCHRRPRGLERDRDHAAAKSREGLTTLFGGAQLVRAAHECELQGRNDVRIRHLRAPWHMHCANADVVLAVPSCRTGAQIAWTGSTRLPAAGATCSNRTRAASSPRFQILRCVTLPCCVSAMGLCLCRRRHRHPHRRHPHLHLRPHTRLCLHLRLRLWPHLHPRLCLHLCLPRLHRHRPHPRPRLQPRSRSRLRPCSYRHPRRHRPCPCIVCCSWGQRASHYRQNPTDIDPRKTARELRRTYGARRYSQLPVQRSSSSLV